MPDLTAVLTDKASRTLLPTVAIRDLTNRVVNPKFATAIPGGFVSCSMSIMMSRIEAYEWFERYLFFGVTFLECDEVIWDGRISDIKVKDYGIDLFCDGYWASAADQTLYSFWADDDMGKWIIPQQGAGGISDEVTGLTPHTPDKFAMDSGTAIFRVGLRKNEVYNAAAGGAGAWFYYRLPRVNNMAEKRVFEPMTIHSISYNVDRAGSWPGGSDEFKFRILVADHPLGTWTSALSDPVSTMTVGARTLNVAADTAAREAIAIGVSTDTGVNYTATQETSDQRVAITNVTIYCDRDSFTPGHANEIKPKKIINGYLKGDTDIILAAKATQLSTESVEIEDSIIRVIPSVFEHKTFQDILSLLAGYGAAQECNLFKNPSAEVNTNGWVGSGVTVTRTAGSAMVGGFGINGLGSAAGSDKIILRELDNTTRITVTPGEPYVFSLLAKSALLSITIRLDIVWYNSGGSIISTSTGAAWLLTATQRARMLVAGIAPETAATAEFQIVEISNWGAAANMHFDAAQIEVGMNQTEYIDGDNGGLWLGTAHASSTARIYPVMTGVYGRKRLVWKARRLERARRWRVSIRELGESGIEFERTTKDYWTRVWTRFQEPFTGLTKFTSARQDAPAQSIIFDQRDLVEEIGAATQEIAELARNSILDEAKRPRSRSEVLVNGYIRNMVDCIEPVFRVRAGDLLFIEDLTPLSRLPDIRDSLRLFTIKETDYDANSNTIKIVPDLPPTAVDLFLAGLAELNTLGGHISLGGGAHPTAPFS